MKGETRLIAETLPTYLELWNATARESFLESLSCYLHNEGYSLQGNKPDSDVVWLARVMFARRNGETLNALDRTNDEIRAEYIAHAETAIACLPDLCDRIGARYITAKAAIETQLEFARAKEKRATNT